MKFQLNFKPQRKLRIQSHMFVLCVLSFLCGLKFNEDVNAMLNSVNTLAREQWKCYVESTPDAPMCYIGSSCQLVR